MEYRERVVSRLVVTVVVVSCRFGLSFLGGTRKKVRTKRFARDGRQAAATKEMSARVVYDAT
jgi:hypothetical protein